MRAIQRRTRVREVRCGILDEVPLNPGDAEYYDREGEPISFREWQRHRQDRTYRLVRQDTAGNGSVTTVWLGTDQGPGEGTPLIYGTLAHGTSLEEERFAADEEGALRNHEKLKRRLEDEV